ncbi:Inorganic pyrophosphatase superfamily [Arabidopsis suecica]|uniref:Inorganic pyrophosphatase superfamily n=1 Tax=Arabidopsis suecica TaxID=45249 RepID=A0A8T1XW75_ARASU|nr:Inorganic pyrophosphatase superfamily [Arabidopsis suecica]
MAATRVMTTAAAASANQIKLCLFTKRPFVLPTRKVCAFNGLCFNEGQSETLDYRVFFQDGSGKKVSPWHDIPLHLGDGVFHFIVEIPKESRAKMEIYIYIYSYNINWNYGLFPQTWEDPTLANSEVDSAFGDNDPVDVVEIGELDWKIVAISLDDPKAHLVNVVDDVEKHFPGTLTAIRDWFRDYKIPDGKPANKFGLGNKPTNKDYALKIIHETNESWAKLVKRSVSPGDLSLF